ncbi:unnamed protein product [Ectocarpus sp. 13 AM-2016]
MPIANHDTEPEGDGEGSSDSLDDLFSEIWERESQPELRFAIIGVGSVVQTQDLQGHRWEVNNFSNTVWEAAIWMHHFFQDERCFPPGWLRGRRVLEIGAGTGLVGLTLTLLGAQVTMTDLPEALPILRHNTDATFATLNDNEGHGDNNNDRNSLVGRENHDHAADRRSCSRPTIRELCWGNVAEAGEVAAAVAAVDGEGSEWEGFDLIVGADVIYNEPTFPALLSTLSDRRLCSENTLVYLATMLRGGRHEGFLEMLNLNGFRVRALDPTCADDLRARVSGDDTKGSRSCGSRIGGGSPTTVTGDVAGGAAVVAAGGTGGRGGKWPGPEWKRGSLPPERRKIHLDTPTDSEKATRRDRRGGRETAADSPANGTGKVLTEDVAGGGIGHLVAPGARKGSRRGNDDSVFSAKRGVVGGGGGGGGWGYKESGLGKILAFAVRRRDSFDGDYDDDRGVGGGS